MTGRDLLFRDADEDDRLVMLHQLRAEDLARRIQRNEDVDGLAGIAGRIHHVRIQIDEAEQAIAREDRRHWRSALRRAEPLGAGNQLRGRNQFQEIGEPALRHHR